MFKIGTYPLYRATRGPTQHKMREQKKIIFNFNTQTIRALASTVNRRFMRCKFLTKASCWFHNNSALQQSINKRGVGQLAVQPN